MANDTFFIFLFVFIIPLVCIGVFFGVHFFKKEMERIAKIFDTQAIKRNGRIVKVLLSYPKLVFSHHTNEVEMFITPGGKNSPPHTNLKITFDITINQKMMVYKEGGLSRVGKFFGAQDIQVGIDSFDREMMIKGSDEYFIRSVLTTDVQDRILRVIKKLGSYIKLDEKQLLIVYPHILDDEYLLDEFINLGLLLTDKIQANKGYYSSPTLSS